MSHLLPEVPTEQLLQRCDMAAEFIDRLGASLGPYQRRHAERALATIGEAAARVRAMAQGERELMALEKREGELRVGEEEGKEVAAST